ncbi:MAG: M48 family metallopeptidase [Hyphomicrobiales bacterium]|nr:M48 family metallopeptidase [Hyphomicrobiales bacterium]
MSLMGSYGLATHIWNNRLRSILLLAGFPLLLLLICFAFALLFASFEDARIDEGLSIAVEWLPTLVPIAIALSLVWWGIAFFANQGIVSAATGSHDLDRRSDPRVWNLLENLCISRGITMPALRIIDTDARNAFASGVREKHYAITVTRGLVEALDDAELEAVLAHELTHIRNRDVQLIIIAAVFVGIISLVGDLMIRSPRAMIRMSSGGRRSGGKSGGGAAILILVAIALFILARFLAIALRFAVSRRREYLADAGAVELTKNPDAMISALRKIAGHSEIEAPSQLRPMFFDLPKASGLAGLFATHPPIEDRITALVAYGGGRDSREGTALVGQERPGRRGGPWS